MPITREFCNPKQAKKCLKQIGEMAGRGDVWLILVAVLTLEHVNLRTTSVER